MGLPNKRMQLTKLRAAPALSLLQATGYLLFSGLGNIGDWAAVVRGWPGGALWRVALATAGGLTYWLATRWAIGQLGDRLHTSGRARAADAYRYTPATLPNYRNA
jgi:hypothetical protein